MKAIDAMVISAHPDDAEFGVAGSVARWTDAGQTVVYVIATNGDKGTTDRNLRPEDLIRIRKKEQLSAANVLGVQDVVFMGYPDQGLEDTPAFRKEIVRLIRQYQPRLVVTSDPYRRYLWHRDHRIMGQVVMDAVFPFARDHLAYPDLMEEGIKPHKVAQIWFWGTDDINLRSDITATFDRKLKALQCHASQVRELGVADLGSWLEKRCRQLAEGEAFELAEAFHCEKLPG
jgi:LmbE family N-acetylglucosaminyl deacetylase